MTIFAQVSNVAPMPLIFRRCPFCSTVNKGCNYFFILKHAAYGLKIKISLMYV